MKSKHAIKRGLFLIGFIFLVSCSKDTESDALNMDPSQQEDPNTPGGEEVETGTGQNPEFGGFDLDLATGDFWEYYWITEEINVAQGSASARTDNGRFRLTLGTPRVIEGVEAYSLEVTGSNLETYAGPRWAYLAAQGNVILGSRDGNSLDTIFNAQNGRWNGGGFFANFDPEATISTFESNIENEFLATEAIVASYQDGQDICEIINGQRICANDDSFSLSVDDYFKAGIGPVGYSLFQNVFDQGGGVNTLSEYRFDIGLVATSFAATDGFSPSLPPWREVTTLPQPFILTTVASWNGKIFVFGGYTSDFVSSRQIYTYDPEADIWETQGQTPVDLAFRYEDNGTFRPVAYKAFVIGNKIYFVRTEGPESDGILIYDPTENTWAAGPDLGGLSGSRCYITAIGNNLLFFPIVPGQRGSVFILNTTTNEWSEGNSSPWPHLERSTVSAHGNKVYFSGTFRSGSFETRVRVYDFSVPEGTGGAWEDIFLPGEGRADAGSQVLNGRLYVMGGDNFGPVKRAVEEYDIAMDSWKTVSSMLNARSGFLSVVLNDKIYAIGAGFAENFIIEEYDPARDRKSQ